MSWENINKDNETIENQNEKKEEKFLTRKDVFDILQVFFQSIIIIALLFMFVFRFSVVHGASMSPTFNDNDWLLLSNLGFQAERGDIVVVSQPNDLDEVLIKRIIALPGETISLSKDGYVMINGEKIKESYVSARIIERGNISFPHTVPEGHVFIMGDNRNDSTDSRFKEIGDIDIRYVVGEAKLRLFPLGQKWADKDVLYEFLNEDTENKYE